MKRVPQKNLARSLVLQCFLKVKSFMNLHIQKTSCPPHPDVVTLISDLNHEKTITDKPTFWVGDDLYEENLPKPHIQYTPHQIKHLQMKDPSLALIINRLQKHTQPQQTLPNSYFLNTDGVLYNYVKDDSQGFEAIVVPKKLYQMVLITCHELLGHNDTTWLYGYIRRFYFWQKLKHNCTKHVHQCRECLFERTALCRLHLAHPKAANVFHCDVFARQIPQDWKW